MSFILYINGNLIELSESKPVAQTKQVNDIAKLDNRQTNYTNKFIAPLTANNLKAMENVYLVGNQSNVPYQKNEASLFDSESGVCLIYKGWATITQTTKKGYEIHIYDGLIDFYRRIENHTLTECSISELNHAKSLTNIVSSWDNNLPYMYAIADYNGKNRFTTPAPNPVDIEINTDYQVPSARVSYLWDKVHQFAGMTYSGSYFQTDDFKNWFMSFPKPVPTLVPHKELIHKGKCYPKHSTVKYYEGNALFEREAYLLTLPRENFSHPRASVTNMDATTGLGTNGNGSMGYVYDFNPINILQNGTYAIDAYTGVNFKYFRVNSSGTLVESGFAESSANGQFKTHLFNCIAGDNIKFIISGESEAGLANLNFDWELNLVDGYEANFEDALVDFQITDFVKEVMVHGGLTAFKDKYSNNIEYLTMSEILKSSDVIDWSAKFQSKEGEKYKIGNYAKRNNFKYRYNIENEKHNDGFILINDENLQDETTAFNSKIYAPENEITTIAGQQVNIFKIWEKELQDDKSIKYKDLSGRFYFLRHQKTTLATTLGSELLNHKKSVTEIAIATYLNLDWKNILINNYPSIKSILDKGKIIDALFYLTPMDVEQFTFKKPIYVEQLGSYYLVNKINSYVKGKSTKCELLEVDYKKEPTVVLPDAQTYITIDSFTVVGCVVTVTYSTNAPLNTVIILNCNGWTGGFSEIDSLYKYEEVIRNTAVQNTVTFTLEAGTYYSLQLVIFDNANFKSIESNKIFFNNTQGCLIESSPSSLVITNVTLVSSEFFRNYYKIDFTTDAVLPRYVHVQSFTNDNPISPIWAGNGYHSKVMATTNSVTIGISTYGGVPKKLQIRIGTKESNIYDI